MAFLRSVKNSAAAVGSQTWCLVVEDEAEDVDDSAFVIKRYRGLMLEGTGYAVTRADHIRRCWLPFMFFGLCAALSIALSGDGFATTKGLSQIVTPDVQPIGDFSLSFQWQAKQIGNPYEFQGELGITKFFEAAIFQGIEPVETIFGAQLALVQKDPYLLTTGIVNWSTRGGGPQPFLEGGYYTEQHKVIVGIQAVHDRIEAVLGYAYDFTKQYRLQVDFQSGKQNFFTFGGTWTPNDYFQVNPAIYFSNERPSKVSGYIVFTFTKHLFGPKEP